MKWHSISTDKRAFALRTKDDVLLGIVSMDKRTTAWRAYRVTNGWIEDDGELGEFRTKAEAIHKVEASL